MTLTVSRPRFFAGPRCRRRTRPTLNELMLNGIARLKAEVEPHRTCLTIGCHLVGWFHDEPIAEILAHLQRWAADPAHLASLGWPRCCSPCWPLSPGEHIAVWRACKVLAVVSIGTAGEAIVHRFD